MFMKHILNWLLTCGMMGIDDLNCANYDTVQSSVQPYPPTIASAATVAPTHFLTFITGTAQIATITPPLSGAHMLIFVFTNAAPGVALTSGNIQRAVAPVQNIPVLFVYDPVSGKYWAGKVA